MWYNDMLLFGMTYIICRNSDTPYSTWYEDILIYSSKDIANCTDLKLGDLILIFLMSSVDNETGNQWCSMDVACWLANYGFGRSLLQATATLQFVDFMNFISKWCDSVCEVLRTDPQHLLGCRHYKLACIIVEEHIEFPDPAILVMYLLPLTLWLDNGHPPITIVTSHQADLTSLAEFCLQHLNWPLDVIQSRLADAHAGVAAHALIQLPGNLNGYFNESLSSSTHKLFVPIQPLATSGKRSDGDPFYDMEIVAVMLEYLRPDLVSGSVCPSSPLSCVELADENVEVKDTLCLKAGIDDPMNEG
ncbi:hypothetical protein F5J12DRAFT_787220 [Pisolithus orientalis]|uniref:uncharacterized protein n=1 Tax=Pisolithus orientalis TaxID=936130 RepID=UPI0022249896|nr:uncharacterized protein F5J12DRAFT_787220 [Pisolithus orientalis]KAI5986543.1 hypothetical protein F5J12DRAFT_787220 [Pisolithus orientalis]